MGGDGKRAGVAVTPLFSPAYGINRRRRAGIPVAHRVTGKGDQYVRSNNRRYRPVPHQPYVALFVLFHVVCSFLLPYGVSITGAWRVCHTVLCWWHKKDVRRVFNLHELVPEDLETPGRKFIYRSPWDAFAAYPLLPEPSVRGAQPVNIVHIHNKVSHIFSVFKFMQIIF